MNFETLKNRLLSLGYKVSCFETKQAAADYVNLQIDGTSVGIGGSKTVEEMGLFPKLSEHNDVWWHWYKSETMTVAEIIDKQRESEVYISSVNGISEIEDKTVESSVFLHIPVCEYENAWLKVYGSDEIGTLAPELAPTALGIKGEGVSCSPVNNGFFSVCKEVIWFFADLRALSL